MADHLKKSRTEALKKAGFSKAEAKALASAPREKVSEALASRGKNPKAAAGVMAYLWT